MLQAIRSQTGSWVVKAFLILIALSFAVWGVGDFVSARIQADDRPIEVGDASISAVDLSREIRQETVRMAPLFNGQLTPELMRQFGLVDQVVNRLVAQTAIDALAIELGIAAGDGVIGQQLAAEPAFHNASGKFDPNVFAAVLRNSGMSESSYLDILRQDIRRRQLVTATTVGVQPPSALVDKLFAYRNEQRVAETITLTADKLPPVAEPTEAELQKFYETNAERYRAPEYRKVVAVNLAPALLARDASIGEESLRAAYDERLNDFTAPGRRKLTQLLFEKEEDAAAAYAQLSEGRDFADVAGAAAGSSGAIDLGWVNRGDLLSDVVAEAAFAAPEGGYSAPVKSDFGWHIFRIDEREDQSVRPFEEVRDEIETQLALDRATEDSFDLANKLEDAVGAGASLENAGRQIGVEPIIIDAVDQNGRSPGGDVLVEQFQLSGPFLTTAFETESGKTSILTEAPNSGFFMLRVDAITESRVKDLSEVQQQVVADWKSEQVEEGLEKLAADIAERLRKGETMSEVSAAYDLPVTRSQAFVRQTGDPTANIGPALSTQLFGLDVNGVATAPGEGGGLTVARLAEIRPAVQDETRRAALTDQVAAQLQSDVIEQLTSDLRARFGVIVNREMIDQLY
ncbi:MAG: peptidyl-prolyl cis-trans isomerase [Rhodospirillales bacterium]